MRFAACTLGSFAITLSLVAPGAGQIEFKKALQKKYDFKSVSCFTCHSRKRDIPADAQPAWKDNPKSFRNAFGKEFDKHLGGKDVTQRLKAVKKLKKNDPDKQKVIDEVVAEFMEALEEVEDAKSEDGDGPTYGELLKQAKLDGVKPR